MNHGEHGEHGGTPKEFSPCPLCPPWFVHAGYVPEAPLDEQPGLALRWRVTDAATATPRQSGKVAVVGHTPQLSGAILNLGFLVCIDTNCPRGGWLSALDVGTGQVWQADRTGRLRGRPIT